MQEESSKIRVLYVKVGEAPVAVTIARSLDEMERLVGGPVDVVILDDDINLWYNNEALLQEHPRPNRFVVDLGHDIFGDFFLARHNRNGNITSLTDADIHKYLQVFKL